MKSIIFLLGLVTFAKINAQDYNKLSVLFLGNSYTYVNNLPQLIKDIALANGDTLIFDSNCPGGQTFQGHFYDPTTVTKVTSKPWDYVVLQAQSQEPSFSPAQVATQTLPYAIKLDSIIKHYNACSETVFYETWGRKYGDASNCPIYPPVCTYNGMQNRLRSSYKIFADTTHSVLSPVGEAFRKSINLNPTLELYSSDQSHPSIEGSYLAACVFYEVLFHKSVLTNTYSAGILPINETFLKQIAHTVVTDSLATWNIGKFSPYAPFGQTVISALNYQFTSNAPSLTNTWYFGDGGISTTINPTHTYSSIGTYTVSHVVYNSCASDSSTSVINILSTNTIEKNNDFSIELYPNPANNTLYFTENLNYIIYDVFGKLCLMGSDIKANISSLANGVYFIELKLNGVTKKVKFLKQSQ